MATLIAVILMDWRHIKPPEDTRGGCGGARPRKFAKEKENNRKQKRREERKQVLKRREKRGRKKKRREKKGRKKRRKNQDNALALRK